MLGKPNTTNAGIFPTSVTSSAGSAVAITLPTTSSQTWVLDFVTFSYKGGTPLGSLQVQVNEAFRVIYSIKAEGEGNWHLNFPEGLYGNPGEQMLITLGSAGASAVGNLSIGYH